MNSELITTLKFIFRNLIERKQCNECDAHWFHFNHGDDKAFYRLGDQAPESCVVCAPLDEQLEAESRISAERWFDL